MNFKILATIILMMSMFSCGKITTVTVSIPSDQCSSNFLNHYHDLQSRKNTVNVITDIQIDHNDASTEATLRVNLTGLECSRITFGPYVNTSCYEGNELRDGLSLYKLSLMTIARARMVLGHSRFR